MQMQLIYAIGILTFAIGALGVLVRKNAIVMFICIELMLNGANILLMGISKYKGLVEGQVIVLFIMAIAAAEAAIGMAIITAFYRRRGGVEVDKADLLRW
ncbi:NADH-quinone oxidoreductase subunit K [Thermosulfidibacter takaii ABI70S6]|uniref:NADH-quinone oxidoreductase subunit K n=1 Tax=Thermosulfidibacter takaii (strain DSM 17441 / JCM 13301 / NBRC 103674 / ABI70S6) TaxID=1298851 RepID=A0A0S3QRT1_THET7|nr:NADH-quinone oxidoreductase subunit NuoK [Thermosulfidibacter takaii]BAT71017.1 NADH-quinone oxidoreductase subunit K [Thermosulfidibacter takaii ABI70S6]